MGRTKKKSNRVNRRFSALFANYWLVDVDWCETCAVSGVWESTCRDIVTGDPATCVALKDGVNQNQRAWW